MKKIIAIVAIIALAGCTDAQRSKVSSLGEPHRITMYSGGQVVRTWVSTGKPQNEEQSDGFYFTDKSTHSIVRVTGDLVIELAKSPVTPMEK